ncbi:hypothetical protein J3L16_01770 [Alteromonas sp. 5E99-2]|uniref:hypothetical protein n=1 Tax=Alteromonas sp. 5E99-2 TaxID=2817683 RepID=UPI001A995C71|nr:hypothetical protein [Alteromonas sp. 5E99-2]MBO1254408.1 hypothetical protein [Alteromonas sp. 5E99-2]
MATLGWVCLLASFYFWHVALGSEFGVLFGLGTLSVFVWIWIVSQYKWQKNSTLNKQSKPLAWNNQSVLRNTAWVLHHFIILMVISSLFTIAFINLLPIERTTQVAAGIISIPIVWAILSLWQLVTVKPWQTFIITLLGGTASALYLFV